MTKLVLTPENCGQMNDTEYCAFASDLGLPVGHFPSMIDSTLGNRLPFQKVHVAETGVRYRQQASQLVVIIFND